MLAGAAVFQRGGFGHAHAFLVEEAIEQAIGAEFGIDNFFVTQRREQDRGARPVFRGVAARVVASDALQKHAAGAPLHRFIARDGFTDGEADAGVGLLAIAEVVLGADGERFAVECDDALVGWRVGALVERQHQAASAEQRRGRYAVGALEFPGGIRRNARVATEAAGGVFGDEQRYRTFALRLHDEARVGFQQRADERGECQRFAEQHGDGARIGMAMQDRVERVRANARDAAAHRRFVQAERGNDVVANGHSLPRHQSSTAFCAWMRFSASSHTADCGPSMTEFITSSPRCAGRQWRKSASLLARAIIASSTA